MQNRDLLFGKALQHIVRTALSNLNNCNKQSVLVSELSIQIFIDRPELKRFIKDPIQKKNLKKRIFSICKELAKSNLYKMERKSGEELPLSKYYIIYTKID